MLLLVFGIEVGVIAGTVEELTGGEGGSIASVEGLAEGVEDVVSALVWPVSRYLAILRCTSF